MVDKLPVPSESADPAPYTETDWELDELTLARLADSVPANTRRAYRVVVDQFGRWCREQERIAFPATGPTLTAYVSSMVTADFAPSAIGQHIGAIRKLHALAGHKGEPDSERALDLLRGYRRQRARDGKHARQAPPLLADDLRRCVEALDLTTTAGRRDQLVLVLGFALMARRSELVALTLADTAETPEGLEVAIRTSKTDKESAGAVVAIPPASHPDLDCVRLVRHWRTTLADHGMYDGPLIRGTTRYDTLRETGISDRTVSAIVQRATKRARLPHHERYTAHSLRAGGLTSALKAGIPLGVAARHGRWSEKSPVVIQYARAADRWRDNAMRGVL